MRTNGNNIGATASIAGYVLAGGASSRFGGDKALARFGDRPLLSTMCERIAGVSRSVSVVAKSGSYREFDFCITEDLWPGEGPLGGIITAMKATEETNVGREWSLIVSCDMPFLTREWLSYLIGRALASEASVIVPRSEHGLEPLCACWRTAALPLALAAFAEGVRKVTEAMKRLPMEVLDETHWKRFDNDGRLFWNMNTQQDYREAVRIWRSENE
jgi:molybdopterin-guanine dinucleotide biosynthesis protein A